MTSALEQRLQAVWYQGRAPALWMRGLSVLFRLLRSSRLLAYQLGLRRTYQFSAPVIVVGNITVGGTGKTPLVILLTEILQAAGYHPGVVSRGYGSTAGSGPCLVTADSSAADVGDEPLMIHRKTGVPVVVGSDRKSGIDRLLRDHQVNIIISDDGLQHLRMARDLEIVVIDGIRGLGNGRLLPAGPLREPKSRLEEVDFVVTNGGDDSAELVMQMDADTLVRLKDGHRCAVAEFAGRQVSAVAGIGHPERFFQQLESAGLLVDRWPFPDHHAFVRSDLAQLQDMTVIMTEKDAVKCGSDVGSDWWVLPITARLPSSFGGEFLRKLEKIQN